MFMGRIEKITYKTRQNAFLQEAHEKCGNMAADMHCNWYNLRL
jgi:hypothetical protein